MKDEVEKLVELIRKYAPTAEQSYYLKGQKPFYAIAEEDIPKLAKDLANAQVEAVRAARIDELRHIDDPINVNLYWNGLISIEDRLASLEDK